MNFYKGAQVEKCQMWDFGNGSQWQFKYRNALKQ